MDLIIYIIVAVLVGGLLTLLLLRHQTATALQKQRDTFEKNNQQLSFEFDATNDQLTSAKLETQELKELQSELQGSITKLTAEKYTAETTAGRVPSLEQELKTLRSTLVEMESKNMQLQTRLEEQEKAMDEKLVILNKAKETLSTEFENLGQKIFEDKSKKFAEQNQTNLGILLKPFKEQISDFQKRVNDIHVSDSKDRGALQQQLINLLNLNQQLSADADNLTKALKGDSKSQGNWGEVILENVLEQSGLRKGQEYKTQEHYTNVEGSRFHPDVILHLPEEKDVVIDSKVSLTAYEQYVNCEDESERNKYLTDHISSIRNHIRDLDHKNYSDLVGLRTLGFVLMFIPIEPAYILAVKEEPNLFAISPAKRIFVVTPSTLMITLRAIHAMWQLEYQNQNAGEIAKQAGNLYDKFVGFVETFDGIGARLDQAQNSWVKARGQLSQGAGNLVKRAEDIRKLGLDTKKQLQPQLVRVAQTESDMDKLVSYTPETKNLEPESSDEA